VSYDDIKSLQQELIRKAQGGSVFIAPITADVIDDDPFTYTAAVTGPPAVPEDIQLTALPTGYEDLGYLNDDGASFENETSQSDVSSWQSISPTRTDLLTDTDTRQVVAQETKLLTIGLYTGLDLSATEANADTGTFRVNKPTRPSDRYYRCFAVSVDGEGSDEILIARFMPRVKVTGKVGQRFGKGDDPISWGVTLTGFNDTTLGYATSYIFGGKGWKAKLAAMGITEAA
jgi:hypothetical protein